MRPKALFFDLDDTLVDDVFSVHQAIEAAIGSLGLLSSVNGLSDFVAAYEAIAAEVWADDSLLFDMERGRLMVWEKVLSRYGISDKAIHLSARDAYSLARRKGALLPDTLSTLDELHRKYELVVITNGDQFLQHQKLSAVGIDHFFSFVVGVNSVNCAKPDAAIFHYTLERLSLKPHEAWHIGDSLLHDVQGAVNAGIDSVWLNHRRIERRNYHPMPTHEIRQLSELSRLLESSG